MERGYLAQFMKFLIFLERLRYVEFVGLYEKSRNLHHNHQKGDLKCDWGVDKGGRGVVLSS